MELAPSQALRGLQRRSGDRGVKHRGGTGSQNEAENISGAPSAWLLVSVLEASSSLAPSSGTWGLPSSACSLPAPVGPTPKVSQVLPLPPIVCFKTLRVSVFTVWMGAVASALSPFHTPRLCSDSSPWCCRSDLYEIQAWSCIST